MDKFNHRPDCQCPPPFPVPPPPGGPDRYLSSADASRLWDKICTKFATNKDVLNIVSDLKRLEANQAVQSSSAVNATAALVMQTLRPDIEAAIAKAQADQRMSIVFVPHTDKHGKPILTEPVRFDVIYITKKDGESGPEYAISGENEFDEWLAIPVPAYERRVNKPAWRWEHIGAKEVDLGPLKLSIEQLNGGLDTLSKRLKKFSTQLGQAILEKAVQPLEELKNYLSSQEFIEYLIKNLPEAGMGGPGLMSANSFNMLGLIGVWCANDHHTIGGGAIGYRTVNHLLEHAGLEHAPNDAIAVMLNDLNFD